MPYDFYRTIVPGWASALEVVADLPPEEREVETQFQIPERSLFLVAVLTTPDGVVTRWTGSTARLRIETKAGRFGQETVNTPERFVSTERDVPLIVLNDLEAGPTTIRIEATDRPLPVAANVMVFHPATGAQGGNPPSPPVPPGGSSFKCRACKTTAKALALSIVAAGTLPILPHALVTAVAAYLGGGLIVAVAFINSVLGDTASVIAEKLCRRVGLCP